MSLEIESDRQVTAFSCQHCGEPIQRVTGFVLRNDCAHAVFFASLYHHNGHEAWLDVILSPTWAEGVDDRVTFGCRVGPISGQAQPGSSLVTGGSAFGESTTFGQKLTREQALAHPLLGEFWEVADHVLVHDPLVRDHVYGPGATFGTT